MGHTVHPYSFRLLTTKDWKSRWFRTKTYQEYLKTDILLREWLEKRLKGMYVSSIEVERSQNDFTLVLRTSRPGMLIGRAGEGIEKLRREIHLWAQRNSLTLPKNLKISVEEVRSPELQAALLAQMIREDLERRLPFRRILKRNVDKIMANREVKGAKIALSGRLDGAEMARYEWLKRGRIPLTTLRADVDFARERARLPYGDIGIKVWIYKGEIFESPKVKNQSSK